MRVIFILLTLAVASSLGRVLDRSDGGSDASYCKEDVLPVSNFDYKQFYGVWYEIGKIQTFEGAKFQIGCRCTAAEHTVPSNPASPSDINEVFSCRKWRPNGRYFNASAVLTNMDPPGNFTETYFPGEPFENSGKYTVIDQGFDDAGNEYRLVYVCNPKDYCVHFFSRNPVLETATIQKLIAKAERMGLNPFGVEFVTIKHDGCW